MCKLHQKKHLNLWLAWFFITEIFYSLLRKRKKRFEDTKGDIESCKSRDGQYSGQKKKGQNNKQRSTKYYTEN
jgi:hypothetical protein